MKMLYVAHPFTGKEELKRQDARQLIGRLQQTAKEKRWDVYFFNPLDAMIAQSLAGMAEEDILRCCLEVLLRSDGLVLTGDWPHSQGCLREFAEAYGVKPLYDMDLQAWYPELQPCPACQERQGMITEVSEEGSDVMGFCVCCANCGARTAIQADPREAILLWDTRQVK